jgi:flavodoxin I
MLMDKAVIIYGSVTGLTEEIAHMLATEIENKYEVSLINALEAVPEDVKDADLILLGSSTWGVGQLQMDMIPVNDFIQKMNLKLKRAAAFGVGDSEFKKYAYAITILEKSLKSAGAQLIQKGYRCDKYFDDAARAALTEWAAKL